MIKQYYVGKIFGIIFGVLFFTGCDTEETVTPRNDKFFIKYYGQDGDQYAADVKQTSDGGYIIVGTSDPDRSFATGSESVGSGDENIIVVKTDALGNEEWTWTEDLNLGLNIEEEGVSILETSSGYVVAGNIYMGSDIDVVVFELSLTGDAIINGPFQFGEIDEDGLPGKETCKNISIINDGTVDYYFISGSTTAAKSAFPKDDPNYKKDPQDFYALKLDLNFSEDTTWNINKITGRDSRDEGIKIYPKTNDPNILVMFGYVDKPEKNVAEFDNDTFTSWQYIGNVTGSDAYYGTTESQICEDVSETIDGYLMVGTLQQGADNRMYFESLSGLSSVSIVNNVIFGNLSLEGRVVIRDINAGNLFLGRITYTSGDKDIFLGKTSLTGIEQWSQTFGSEGLDDGAGLVQNPDGSIVFTGTMNISGQRKITLIKTNANGELKL